MRAGRIDMQAARARYGTGLGHVSPRWGASGGRSTARAQTEVAFPIWKVRYRRGERGGAERRTGAPRDGWGSRSMGLGGGVAGWGFWGSGAGPRATGVSILKVADPSRIGVWRVL